MIREGGTAPPPPPILLLFPYFPSRKKRGKSLSKEKILSFLALLSVARILQPDLRYFSPSRPREKRKRKEGKSFCLAIEWCFLCQTKVLFVPLSPHGRGEYGTLRTRDPPYVAERADGGGRLFLKKRPYGKAEYVTLVYRTFIFARYRVSLKMTSFTIFCAKSTIHFTPNPTIFGVFLSEKSFPRLRTVGSISQTWKSKRK